MDVLLKDELFYQGETNCCPKGLLINGQYFD